MPRSLVAALVGMVAVFALASAAPAQTPEAAVEAALAAARDAVAEAFGGDAEASLSRPVMSMAPGAGLPSSAVAEPGSRTGGPVRFVLYAADGAGRRRVGRLTADVRVRAPHVRTRAAVAARTVPTAEALEAVRDDVGRQVLGPLPTLSAVTSSTTRRALMAGEVVTMPVLTVPAAVVSGDEVVTVARVAGIEVRGRAIASQSGSAGETVIVVNPDSRKRLRGRVVGPALVEVLHGS